MTTPPETANPSPTVTPPVAEAPKPAAVDTPESRLFAGMSPEFMAQYDDSKGSEGVEASTDAQIPPVVTNAAQTEVPSEDPDPAPADPAPSEVKTPDPELPDPTKAVDPDEIKVAEPAEVKDPADEAPNNIRLNSTEFSDAERLAALMVKQKLAPDMRTALDRISPRTEPSTQVPSLTQEERELQTLDKTIAEKEAQQVKSAEDFDTANVMKISRELTQLEIKKSEVKRNAEVSRAFQGKVDISIAKAIELYPESKDSSTTLGRQVAGYYATLADNDPLRSDPEHPIKVAELCAKAIGLKSSTPVLPSTLKTPAKVVQPPLVKPMPISGSKGTKAPVSVNKAADEDAALAKFMGDKDAHMLAHL